MAIYHLSVKAVSRSDGRSATASAAYRAGCEITDERTGEVFDFRRKGGIDYTEIILPVFAGEWAKDRAALWNAAELAEKRKDACVAREFEVALPIELSTTERRQLVIDFAREFATREGCAVDVAIHHDQGENPHAHLLRTTRKVEANGLGEKLDTEKAGRKRADDLAAVRARWEDAANLALERAGQGARIDHRTLVAQGIDRIPQVHVGPHVLEMEARGIETDRGTEVLKIDMENNAYGRHHEIENGSEPGTDRNGTRAFGASNGRADGRNTGDTERDPAGEQGTGRDVPPPGRNGDGRMEGGGGGSTESRRELERRGTADGVGALRTGRSGGHDYGGARDRLVALAGTGAEGAERAEPGGSRRAPETGYRGSAETHTGQGTEVNRDRSYLAVRRQLDAMASDTFEIGIRDQDGRMMMRTWSKADTLKAVPWLKRENAKGADIYVRPATVANVNAGLVLLDDVQRGTLDRMKADGFAPAAVIETSPDNFQAWVRLSDHPLSPEIATLAAQSLAKRYDADPNSADWRHFGRLAGFTNRKPIYTDERGRNPWVLAHECPGKATENAYKLVSQCEVSLDKAEAKKEAQKRLDALLAAKPNGYASRYDPLAEYQRQAQRLLTRYGNTVDFSRLDWMIATDMAKSGRWTVKDIERGIRECSPNIESRKTGHIEDYAQRTATKAWANPEVQAARQEQQERSKKNDHGLNR